MGSDRKCSGMTIAMIDMNGWMKTSRLKRVGGNGEWDEKIRRI